MSNGFEITLEDLEKIEEIKSYQIKSGFSFLQQQNGLKKGMLHTIVSPKGSGKSTLVRSIIFDYLEHNPEKSVFLYLSEEKEIHFKSEMADNFGYDFSKIRHRLHVMSEKDQDENFKVEKLADKLFNMSEMHDCELFVYDNLTTSKLYGEKPWEQSEFIHGLVSAISDLNVATIVVAHTAKGANKHQLLSGDDVRGSNKVTMLSEFLYVAQMLKIGEKSKQFIQVDKHRMCNIEHTFFYLNYDHDRRLYTKDNAVHFEEFKDWFKQRNKF